MSKENQAVDAAPVAATEQRPPFQVLVLCPEMTDYLWLKDLLGQTRWLDLSFTWCPDPYDCEDLMQQVSFDAVLWECHEADGAAQAFLQYLDLTSVGSPIIVIGPEPEGSRCAFFLRAGAHDYLCKGTLDAWSLLRALRGALYRNEAREDFGDRAADAIASGIINRDLFFDRLSRSLLRAERQHLTVGLLHLNLDGFRAINETLGYLMADRLILRVAERLRQVLRKSDSLMRIAGDEFAIVLESVEDSLAATHVVRKILEVLLTPFELDGHSVPVTVSIGVALYPEAGETPEQLLRQANRAMFEAKRESGNSYRFFNPALNASVERTLQLEAELRQALRREELELYYQPRIDLASEMVEGVECLLRWNHPQHGVLAPDEFIPAAERSGLIVPIGYWVIEQACKRLPQLGLTGHQSLIFAVNLSFRQFHDRKMTETIFRIIFNANIDTRLLELELTESAMMHDPDYAQRCLRELSQLGISFALDDFGTGFSSLSNLQHLPITLVKIDKSFVRRLEDSEDARHIVRAVISLAHSLGMLVVAEGVETLEQLQFLKHYHCDQVQGFYFARPMPWDELLAYLDRRSEQAIIQPSL
ncbi:bifunctional diguanylate cyclase/phosphodiesterase [Marinobacteraceae bacterium S3BR75-40.1]